MGWRSYCLEIKSQDAYERLTGLDWVPSIDAGYVAEKDITPVGQSEDFFSGSEVAIPKGALFVVLPIDSGDLRMRAVFVDASMETLEVDGYRAWYFGDLQRTPWNDEKGEIKDAQIVHDEQSFLNLLGEKGEGAS